ncbi:hypothetical protein PHLGIDRAFT_99162 [Phlebiopsis gigantea 11061_1 CR5-6]|uniref:Uncharacterized protein n=1 Tax=Phlebiopsis gigantea (strain 11061_1 CR5-6) TaxID=745531 RepID=A0A0C3PV83_PHLG1|nr:hypothetical protein PHLGIDRAFT_99162 [Phlebiopsis gigantea 11061_1 CR5-6]
MDLTEEDMLADGASSLISLETPKDDRRPRLFRSSSSVYSFTSDDLAEEDRRRKRDKLAKLHRFLGSRVPVEVVLAQLSLDAVKDLPPVVPVTTAVEQPLTPMDNDARKTWIRRRRSSSAGELGGKWSDGLDRLKEELNNREKALNVKRAVKMEKMFGVAPPQTLYHTRSAVPPAGPSSSPPQYQASPSSPVSPSSRNVNRTAYSRNKAKKYARPGTADSSEPLISPHGNSRSSGAAGFSEIYEHYRHSLNSLNDILDRDDKESLQRLHGIIHGEADAPLQTFTREESPSPPPTPKAERRRSLPTRASITSLASEYSITASINTTPPEEQAFQTRRRRAAKLTQFFGVDYRDLVNEVFESLESGLQEESGRGTLRPDEVQELLHKLRKLKTKRNSLFD